MLLSFVQWDPVNSWYSDINPARKGRQRKKKAISSITTAYEYKKKMIRGRTKIPTAVSVGFFVEKGGRATIYACTAATATQGSNVVTYKNMCIFRL